MNSSPHHLQTTHLASAATAPRGERREFHTDQRLVRSLACIAPRGARVTTPGLSSLSPLARLRTYRAGPAVREFMAIPPGSRVEPGARRSQRKWYPRRPAVTQPSLALAA